MDSSSNTTEEWLPELLAEYRFNPPEDRLAKLLKTKMEGKHSPINHKPWGDICGITNQVVLLFLSFFKALMQGKAIIPEIDVYKFDAWDLPERLFPDSPYQARHWFAYSRPDYKYTHGSVCNRTTENGFWKRTGQPRRISSESGTCVKRTMTFHEGHGSKSKTTGWVMQEYCLSETEAGCYPNQQKETLFLCRLRNKPAKKKSDSKTLKDTSMSDVLFDPAGTGGYIASNSEGDRATADPSTSGYVVSNSDDDQATDAASSITYMTPDPDPEEHLPHKGLDAQEIDDMIQELHCEPPQLENVRAVYNNEYSNWKSPLGDDSYPENVNNIAPNYGYEPAWDIPYNYQDRPTYERSPEVFSQWDETPDPLFHSFHPQNNTLQSETLYSEQGDFQHANNYIGCYGPQSQYPEIASLFPYSS